MRGRSIIVVALLLLGLMLSACTSDDADDTAADDGGTDTAAAVEESDDQSEEDADAAEEEVETDTDAAATDDEDEEVAESDDAGESSDDADAGDEIASGEIDIEHAQGTTTVPLNPEVVAVFDYSVIDALDHLGVQIAGLPKGNLPPFLSAYDEDEYENIGTLFEPDYEIINALNPDLIIVAGRSSAVYDELADMAPTIDLTVDEEDFLNSYKAQVRNLGMIFQMEDEVENVLAEVDATIERIHGLTADFDGQSLIVMTSGGEVTAYGPGSRFGMIHDLLGVPAAEDDIEAATHGDAISFEFIQERNPDILYVLDRDAAIGQEGDAAEAVLDNELVHSTNAWINDRVIYLDTATWYLANAGLSTFPSMLDEIEQSLQ